MIGIALDPDLKPVRDMVGRTGITWPQICDGKGPNTELARLFNASVPTQYVLDRDGMVAAKHVGFYGWKKISNAVAQLMPK